MFKKLVSAFWKGNNKVDAALELWKNNIYLENRLLKQVDLHWKTGLNTLTALADNK